MSDVPYYVWLPHGNISLTHEAHLIDQLINLYDLKDKEGGDAVTLSIDNPATQSVK